MTLGSSAGATSSNQPEHTIVKPKNNKVDDAEMALSNLESISGAINHLSISSIELKENEQIHLQDMTMNQVVLAQPLGNDNNPLADTSSTMI